MTDAAIHQEVSIVLELDAGQLDVLDRALTGFSKALLAARDMGVISHETFCNEADKARAVQYLVWETRQKLEATSSQAASGS